MQDKACGMQDTGYGMRDKGCDKSDMGIGMQDMGYEIWDTEYRMLPRSRSLWLCEQCHGTVCWLSLLLCQEEGNALAHA